MAIIRQFPDNSGCAVCNSLVDLPHRDLSDCRAALAREMDAVLERAKVITETQRSLTRRRMSELQTASPAAGTKRRRKAR